MDLSGGRLAGKTVLVTGASKGMGRHFVDALVAAGANVAAVARPSPELDAVAGAHGSTVTAVAADISDPDAATLAVETAVGCFGRLDAVVNNAAVFEPFLIDQATDAQVRAHVDVNILGVVWMMRGAVPHLRRTRGQIVTISSESVRTPFPMLALYAATKAAIEALSQGLRDELRDDGIRVSVLRSGSVAGGSGGARWSADATQEFYRRIVASGHAQMTGTPATPQSMAQALVAMLALPEDINADLVEVRSARSGVPDGAKG